MDDGKPVMSKLFTDLLTEKDGETIDPVRFFGMIGFVIYNCISVWHSFLTSNEFSYVQYATGLSIIIGVISAGITFKYKNEKDCQ